MRWGRLKDQKVCSGEIMHGTYFDPETVAHEAATVCSLTELNSQASVVVEGKMLHIIN